MKIMVVDDEVDLVRFFQDFLELDFKVTTFTDATLALAHIDGGNYPDVLITDLQLPKISGIQLIKTVRQKLPTLPVVVISGYPEDHESNSTHGLEIHRFFEKPFNPSLLHQTLVDLRNKLRAEQAPSNSTPPMP